MMHIWNRQSECMSALLQDLMKGAPDTPNVVEACNLEGRQERLDGLLSQLEMCEKALQASTKLDWVPANVHTFFCTIAAWSNSINFDDFA